MVCAYSLLFYASLFQGRIKWARSLKYHLDGLLGDALEHPILQVLPATVELTKKYNIAMGALNIYEQEITATWMNHNVGINLYYYISFGVGAFIMVCLKFIYARH